VDTQLLLCESGASSSPALGEPSSRGLALPLNEYERLALVRALYVVKDNWWLDPTEESLLQRLELPTLVR
jgi:hypothetical protein